MRWLLAVGATGLFAILTIAGSDRLFTRTVPLDQRLVSRDEAIRMKAQQSLLGLSSESKRERIAQMLPMLSATDPFVRKWTAISIALTGPIAKDAIPGLLSCVADSERDVAQACRVALSEIGAPEPAQLPLVAKAFESPNAVVRCEAASAVAKMGEDGTEAIAAFVELVKNAKLWNDCTERAATFFAQRVPAFSNALLPLLEDESPSTRRHASAVLAAMESKSPEVLQALLATLGKDTDAAVRRTAASGIGLAEAPERGLYPALVEASQKAKDDTVRELAFAQLKNAAATAKVPLRVMADRLHDDSASIRLMAVQWFAERGVGARTAATTLVKALSDPDARIRLAAMEALRATGARGLDVQRAVAKAQRDAPADVRCLIAEWLVEVGAADRVAAALLAKDVSSEEEWRCAANVLVYAAPANDDVVPAVGSLFLQPNREVHRRAVHIAAQLGVRAKPLRTALRKAVQDEIPGAPFALRQLPEPRPSKRSRR